MPEFDLADALAGLSKTQLGEVVEPGLYPMRVESCEYAMSKNKGTPGWTYKAVVTDGELEGEVFEGTAWWSAKPRGTELYWQQMTALGVTLEWVQAVKPTNEQIAEAIVGARFMGDVGIEEPQPGTRQRRRNRLIAHSAIAQEGGEQSYAEPEVDSSGEVLVDDLFTGADVAPDDTVAVSAPSADTEAVEGPTGDLDDPSVPGPDGTAGEEATPLAEPAAGPDAANDPDDPWS